MNKEVLKNKVAIITGASSGIGKSIAFRFADEGAKVILASRTLSRSEEVAKEISGKGQSALAISCDVSNEKEIISLFDQSEKSFGSIDIVVANAGISGGNKTIADYNLEDWNKVLATNLTGVFLTVREAFRRMQKNGGHIIVMSSQAGVEGYAGKGAYSASKFGVRGIAHVLSEEGRKFNINVSTICPGTVDTPILSASNTKVKYPMNPNAVADAAVYLATLSGNSLIRDVIIERMLLD